MVDLVRFSARQRVAVRSGFLISHVISNVSRGPLHVVEVVHASRASRGATAAALCHLDVAAATTAAAATAALAQRHILCLWGGSQRRLTVECAAADAYEQRDDGLRGDGGREEEERERERLRNENGDLRSILKQYLDGISVNEDVINAPNPLLVVNHKTNIVMPAAYQRPPANTIVEGSHTVLSQVNNQLAQGRQGASI